MASARINLFQRPAPVGRAIGNQEAMQMLLTLLSTALAVAGVLLCAAAWALRRGGGL